MYFERKYRLAMWGFSIFVAIILFSALFMQGIYVPAEPYWIPIDQRVNSGIVLGIILILAGPGFMEFNNGRWLRAVDNNAPRLLRDVTESVQSGVPLFRALEEATTRDYGPISKHLETAMVKFNLTSNLEESLDWLGEKLIRPSMKRICTILTEAYKTGGDIIDVLTTSVEIFTDVSEYNEERHSQTRPYVMIVYLGLVVFLVISWLVLTKFLAPMIVTTADPLVGDSGLLRTLLDINYYKATFFWAAVVEGLFGGLIAGKMGEGRLSAGVVHSMALLLMTVIFFNSINLG